MLIFDDSIEEKPYTDENDIICWHYDHSKERNVKGINFLTALYHTGEVSLPVAFQLVAKTEPYERLIVVCFHLVWLIDGKADSKSDHR